MIRFELNIDNYHQLSDEEIIKDLIKIKGIGPWTAEMFLIFSLNRKNVMSYKDLGLRRGMQWLYGMKEEPTVKEFEAIKRKYTPYGTLASFYLWEVTIRNYYQYESIEDLKKY